MQAKITKRTVDAIAATVSDVWVWDADLKGFGVRVRTSGRKTYVVEYRPGAGGRAAPKRRFVIGQHGSPWTPETARSEARRILGLVESGHDPVAERTEARRKEGENVAEIAAVFVAKYCKLHQRSWEETERVFLKDVNPRLGAKRLQDVTKGDLARLLDAVAERGPIMANRTLAYMRRFFNWCIEKDYITTSPATGLKPPGAACTRERTLDDGELMEVWRAAKAVGSVWEPLVMLLILTAQRRSEVAGILWGEVDFERRLWTLPAERAKNGRTHEVPLVDAAIAVLKAVPRLGESALVFTTTGYTPVSGLSKAKIILDRAIAKARGENAAPMPGWTFHDLRRTATTGMARLGIHPHVADAILNHKSGAIQGVAAIYNRHAYTEERRRALEAWERHVLALLDGMPMAGGNVVKPRGGA
ncbi:MAG: putative phage integrase [Rhodospirillaceae bacterium]|nr:MAG: putative phage integrase [Rhodospirillaceae bacterium]